MTELLLKGEIGLARRAQDRRYRQLAAAVALPLSAFALATPTALAALLNCAEAGPADFSAQTQGAIVSMTWDEVAQRALELLSEEERRK